MGFLTFLPFLLKIKGADLPMIGIALTLVFTGGAAGKLICGWLGVRLGVVRATFVTEGLTAAGILLLLPLPLTAGLVVLPLIGVALNGTSSVLYGTVPELVAPERRQRAFSIFYTGGVGAGALAPVLYGFASDLADVTDHDAVCRRRGARHLAARLAARPLLASHRGRPLTGVWVRPLLRRRLGIPPQPGRQQLARLSRHSGRSARRGIGRRSRRTVSEFRGARLH
jgi:MFS family permease